jgi:hypothetical protein
MRLSDGKKVQGHGSRTTYPWSGQMQLPLYNISSTLGSPALYPSRGSALNSGLCADHTPRHGRLCAISTSSDYFSHSYTCLQSQRLHHPSI